VRFEPRRGKAYFPAPSAGVTGPSADQMRFIAMKSRSTSLYCP